MNPTEFAALIDAEVNAHPAPEGLDLLREFGRIIDDRVVELMTGLNAARSQAATQSEGGLSYDEARFDTGETEV